MRSQMNLCSAFLLVSGESTTNRILVRVTVYRLRAHSLLVRTCAGCNPSSISLWKDLKSSGDGWQTGTHLDDEDTIGRYLVRVRVLLPRSHAPEPRNCEMGSRATTRA